jgi:WD repeat-containing protein 1 (actin-interacting protein 1)
MEVAVGGDNSKVHIYQLTGTSLELKRELEHLGSVTNCAFSPDMKYLVACDVNRKVILYGLPDYKVSKL